MLAIPPTVLFDLRGTLVDAEAAWRLTDALRVRFLRSCGACGRDDAPRRALERAVADVNALTFRRREYFDQDRLVLERAAVLAGVEATDEQLDEFERWRDRAFARTLRAFPDARPTLERLRSRGIRLGCVGDGRRDAIRQLLDRTRLLDSLDVVVASEESGEVKATGAALRLACARLGVEPRETLFVGDRLDKDVRMAEAAGARTLLLDRSGKTRAPGVETISSLLELLDRPLAVRGEARWRQAATT